MVKEFSHLIHLMEQGYKPKNFGSGWLIQRPDPQTHEMATVEVDRFAISQAKRFECIDIVVTASGQEAVLRHESDVSAECDHTGLSEDMTPLSHKDRLAALVRTGLMDSPPEESFDRITRLAARDLRCPISLVTLVSGDRQFFKSIFGLTGPITERRTTGLEWSLCKFVAANGKELIVYDAQKDSLVKGIPIVNELNVQAYAAYPIWSMDKHALGALCVVDHKPRRWTKEELDLLREFAGMADVCIEASELHHTYDKRFSA